MHSPRRRALLPLALVLLFAVPVLAAEPATLRSSDEEGLSLHLSWDEFLPRSESGDPDLRLPGCRMDGESGGPALPVWAQLVALPPGHRAELSWALRSSRALSGRPLPYPTPRKREMPGGEPFYDEVFTEDAAAFARALPLGAELGEIRQLRDLRVVELFVRPVGWNPESGLRMVTEMDLALRFVPDPGARETGEPLRGPEKIWGGIYASALLNGDQAAGWARREPASPLAGGRQGGGEALLKLRTSDDGLYGLSGDSLLAHGLAAGTPLDEIALFRRRFAWVEEQPEVEDVPVPRFWLDADEDGLLDAEDRLVFLGHRLRHEPETPDSIEWFGREGKVFLARDASLVLEMDSAPGWQEGTGFATPPHFERHLWEEGEKDFFVSPPHTLYDLDPVTLDHRWESNLYYMNPYNSTDLYLDLPSPAYVPGTAASLELLFQGYSSTASRVFTLDLENADGLDTDLTGLELNGDTTVLYQEALDAEVLADGVNQLHVDRIDSAVFWAMIKTTDLRYRSYYQAGEDSLFFGNGDENGPVEIRVSGLGGDWAEWLLVETTGVEPVRIVLDADNQQGGDLVFRDGGGGERRWWAVRESSLRVPGVEPAADLSFLADTGPYDVIAIAHADFMDLMEERWKPYRESQGWRVKLLSAEQVWDGFFRGSPGSFGIRNAARFAYRQWGAEALLLVGDASKDARELNEKSDRNFMPVFCCHEEVSGDNEIVALDEWVVRFAYNAWPSMIMGRIPAGSVEELETFLDKLECFESPEAGENCAGDGPWRKRVLQVADDHWSYDLGMPAAPNNQELYFQSSQEEALARVDSCPVNEAEWGLPGDVTAEPFFESVTTVPWYESHPGVLSTEISALLRPIMWPMFVDSLSQGWTHVLTQSHANRNQLTHEFIFKTGDVSVHGDHDYLENVGMPFIWSVLGCHANGFCISNELQKYDCMGEKLLFLDRNRGAVASWASDGYEYLWPNGTLGNHVNTLLFYRQDWEQGNIQVFPEWVLGGLLSAAKLRWNQYSQMWRYLLLGDPLTRVDMGPPRLRLFRGRQVGEEMLWFEQTADSFISVASPNDTLEIRAFASDEAYVTGLSLSDAAHGEHAVEAKALVDSVAAANLGWSRAWELRARVPFDGDMEALVLRATDRSGRESSFELPVARLVRFFTADGDSLSDDQYVESSGELRMRVQVPHTEMLPSQFHLYVDSLDTGLRAVSTEDPLVHEILYDYDWEPGRHGLEVLLDGNDSFGSIVLRVDRSPELLDWVIFPNPFRDSVFFRYRPSGEILGGEVKVFTLSGRMIRRLPLESLSVGAEHWLEWDGRDQSGDPVANGTYLLKVRAETADGEELLFHDRVVRMR